MPGHLYCLSLAIDTGTVVNRAAASGNPLVAAHGKSANNVLTPTELFTNTLPSSARLQFEIFAASTSTCSIRGASASNSGALAISAAATGPARCALRPASS